MVFTRTALALLLVCPLWAVLAFGGVYPWAYLPLAFGCLALGPVAVCGVRQGAPAGNSMLLMLMLMLLCSVTAQLTPLSRDTLIWISPGTDEILRQLNLQYATDPTFSHPLTINPTLTARALLLAAALMSYFIGAVTILAVSSARVVLFFVPAVGAFLSILAIVQNRLSPDQVYGFWISEMVGSPFGPFINRNHFGGWMVMAIPVTLGLAMTEFSRRERSTGPAGGYPSIQSALSGRAMVLSVCALIMTLSLLITASRSAIAALAVAVTALGCCAWFRGRNWKSRSFIGAFVVTTGSLVALVLEPRAVLGRFLDIDWSARLAVWRDALAIVQSVPFSGTGLNTFTDAMLLFQTADARFHFAQAHNDYLQLLAEGGLLLGLPTLALFLALAYQSIRLTYAEWESSRVWIRLGAMTGLTGIAIQEVVDFSLQIPANAVLFALLAAVAARPARTLKVGSQHGGSLR